MRNRDDKTLVAQLQMDVTNSSVPISDILRKAKILASLLGNDKLKRWADAELAGYKSVDDLPDYRKLTPMNFGTFAGSFGKMAKNLQIPISSLPSEVKKFALNLDMRQGIKEIETLTAQTTAERFRVPWPAEAVLLARDHIPMSDDSVLVEAWKPITESQLDGILDQVRNRLLDFLLELEHTYPEVMNSENAIRAAGDDSTQNIVMTTIYGGQNTVATGTNVAQNITNNVSLGNIQSLVSRLRSTGLDNDLLNELEAAVAKDGERQQQNGFGEHVTSWMGKAMGKAMNGTWKIVISTMPRVLQEALFQYYGGK